MASRQIARGTVYLTIQQITSYLTAFAFYAGIARLVSQQEVGQWSVLMATTATFSNLTLLGLHVAAQRYISERQAKHDLAGAATALRGTIELATYATLPAMAAAYTLSAPLSNLILGSAQHATSFAIVILASVVLNFVSLLGAELLGLGMYFEAALQNIVFFLVSRCSSLLLAYSGLGLMGLALGWLVGGLSSLTLSIRLTWHRLPKPEHTSRNLYRGILAYSHPVWLLAIITLAQGWADVTILYGMTGEAASTGIYYLSASGAMILAIFWGAISTAIFPAMSAAEARGGTQALRPILRAAGRLLNLLVLPFGAALAAISRTAISIAYGPTYHGGVIPFAILASTAILPAYFAINTSALQAIAETRSMAKAGAVSAAIEILLVSILARPLGAVGAASARAAMYATASLLTHRVLTARAGIIIDRSHLAKSSVMALLAAVVLATLDLALTDIWPIHWLPRITIEGAALSALYLVSLRQLELVEPSDLELLRAALPNQLHACINKLEQMILHKPRSL